MGTVRSSPRVSDRPPQDDVAAAMDVVREVGDLVPPGDGPGDPDGGLHRFAAGAW